MNNCCNCGHSFYDISVNDIECECTDITEQELQEHFTNDKPNCTYWIERKQEVKPLTARQVNLMFEAKEI